MLKNWTQSNVWMSLSVTLLTALFYLQIQAMDALYLVIVFLGSNAVYHFHRLIRNIWLKEATFSERDGWLSNHKRLLWVWVVLSGGISLVLFWTKGIVFTKTIGILVLAVFFYALPFMKHKGKWIKLRDIPFFKVFLVAFIWAMVSVFLPIELLELHFDPEYYLYFLSHFLLIFAITLPFDIRDVDIDKTKTFANTLGIEYTKKLSVFILLMWCFTVFYTNNGFQWEVFITFCMSWLIISKTQKDSPPLHYAFYIEAIPILYFGCVWLINSTL